ncbi:MAG TPA: CD225/dispanin family protein [Sporichthyaceae bacterium]|nr:CD225/dispanin family protein [Sporichthyaceae bacterium]
MSDEDPNATGDQAAGPPEPSPYGRPPQPPQYGGPPAAPGPVPQYGEPSYGQTPFAQTPYGAPPGQPPFGSSAGAPAPDGAGTTGAPKNYLLLAVAATVMGIPNCLGAPIGVAGIVYANRVNRCWLAGDRAAAQAYSRKTRTLVMWAFVVDVLALVLGIALQAHRHR